MAGIGRAIKKSVDDAADGLRKFGDDLRLNQKRQGDKIRDDTNRSRDWDNSQEPPKSKKKKKEPKYPPKGTPNSKGYDENGNRLPYANNRPSYSKTQVKEVFDNTHRDQVNNPPNGMDPPGPNQIYVQNTDGSWDKITWKEGDARRGVWDMGHNQDSKYSRLHDRYMNGEISKQDFLDEYRSADNYFAEGSARNQSHMDE